MKYRIKESKNIFPCTVYMENQDYDEAYYYLDTPEYGLSWRYFDDVEQEDVENYKYIIKNTADLRKAIDDLEEDFIHGYGNSYFKLSENYMEDLLNRGKTLVRVKKEHKERVYIIRVKPAQNVELALAESFEKTIKSLQKEGLFENVKSFDLSLKNNRLNIKLNENEDESTYRWGVTFDHNMEDDEWENSDDPNFTFKPDKVFKTEEDADEACREYMDSDPTSFCQVYYLDKNNEWDPRFGYEGSYGGWSDEDDDYND